MSSDLPGSLRVPSPLVDPSRVDPSPGSVGNHRVDTLVRSESVSESVGSETPTGEEEGSGEDQTGKWEVVGTREGRRRPVGEFSGLGEREEVF